MTYEKDAERAADAMHAVDCGCDGSCGYPYREMVLAAIDALDLPSRDRRVKAEALKRCWCQTPEPASNVIHAIPRGDDGLTPCCSRNPFELPRQDRLTLADALVTCRTADPA